MDQRAFAAFLVSQGVISDTTLSKAREHQAVMSGRLDTVLLGMGAVSEGGMLKALGAFCKARTVSGVELATADPVVARIVSPRVARRFMVAPFRKEGGRLSIASMMPLDLLVEDELALLTGCMVSSFVALEIRMLEFLARHAQLELPLQMSAVLKVLRGTSTGAVSQPRPPRAATQSELPAADPDAEDSARESPPAAASATARPATPAPPRPRRADPSELEIDDEDLALFPSLREVAEATPPPLPPPLPRVEAPAAPAPPAEASPELSPEERLVAAADGLQSAEMRDDIADAVLEFCAPYLARRMLLVVRQGTVVGWRGEGAGVDEAAVRAIAVPLDQPSVFVGLSQGTSFWLGTLPPMPRNLELVLGLGGERPKDCVILPVAVRSKIVCFLYGDNLDRGVAGVPMALLRRLISKASVAFQVYLLKSKIRLL